MSITYTIIVLALAAAIAAYWIFPIPVVRLVIGAGRRLGRMRLQHVLADGETWYYLEGGPRDAPVVLLIHGFGTDKDSWLLYVRHFTRRYRVIAPDLPGFGQAPKDPDAGYTAGAQARHLRAFVDALGLERFHLAGISMGGLISALYALEHPEQVASLVLFDNAGVDIDAISPLRQQVDDGKNPLVVRSTEEFDAMIELITWKPPWVPGAFKRYFLDQVGPNAELHDRIFWGLVEEFESEPLNARLGELTMPTLIIWGRQDRLFPASTVDIMMAAMPDAKSLILDKTGHAPTIERPYLAAKRHLEFLDALSEPGRAIETRGQAWN